MGKKEFLSQANSLSGMQEIKIDPLHCHLHSENTFPDRLVEGGCSLSPQNNIV